MHRWTRKKFVFLTLNVTSASDNQPSSSQGQPIKSPDHNTEPGSASGVFESPTEDTCEPRVEDPPSVWHQPPPSPLYGTPESDKSIVLISTPDDGSSSSEDKNTESSNEAVNTSTALLQQQTAELKSRIARLHGLLKEQEETSEAQLQTLKSQIQALDKQRESQFSAITTLANLQSNLRTEIQDMRIQINHMQTTWQAFKPSKNGRIDYKESFEAIDHARRVEIEEIRTELQNLPRNVIQYVEKCVEDKWRQFTTAEDSKRDDSRKADQSKIDAIVEALFDQSTTNHDEFLTFQQSQEAEIQSLREAVSQLQVCALSQAEERKQQPDNMSLGPEMPRPDIAEDRPLNYHHPQQQQQIKKQQRRAKGKEHDSTLTQLTQDQQLTTTGSASNTMDNDTKQIPEHQNYCPPMKHYTWEAHGRHRGHLRKDCSWCQRKQ